MARYLALMLEVYWRKTRQKKTKQTEKQVRMTNANTEPQVTTTSQHKMVCIYSTCIKELLALMRKVSRVTAQSSPSDMLPARRYKNPPHTFVLSQSRCCFQPYQKKSLKRKRVSIAFYSNEGIRRRHASQTGHLKEKCGRMNL